MDDNKCRNNNNNKERLFAVTVFVEYIIPLATSDVSGFPYHTAYEKCEFGLNVIYFQRFPNIN